MRPTKHTKRPEMAWAGNAAELCSRGANVVPRISFAPRTRWVARSWQAVLAFLAVAGWTASVSAQNLAPNPSFEAGVTTPEPWTPVGAGAWENFGRTGNRCVSILGEAGVTRGWSGPLTLDAQRGYWVRFWASASNALSGYLYGGLSTASRDFRRASRRWSDFAYAAWVPAGEPPQFRMMSSGTIGPIYFDDAEVLPLVEVHRPVGDYELGEGESLRAGTYRFQAPFASFGGNCARPLHAANTAFNTYRWYFNPGSVVIYRHELAGQPFSNAVVGFQLQNYNNLNNTTLLLEAGTDGTNWLPVGSVAQYIAGNFPVPAELLPAPVVFIRLRSTNASQFSLAGYSFTAQVPDTVTDATGTTHYFGRLHPGDDVRVLDVSLTATGRVATLAVPNFTASPRPFTCEAVTTLLAVERARVVSMTVPPLATNLVQLPLPTAGAGDNTTVLTVRDAATNIVFQQIHRFTVQFLDDDSFGERLPSPAECPVWTCSGNYKVGRNRGLPVGTTNAVRLALARNEYEPFQLILRPPATLSNVWVSVGNFVSVTNPAVSFSATNVTIDRVDYVNVSVPDPGNFAAALGDHPDPLPPLTAPFTAPGGTNSPLWFTVYAPKDVPAGEYAATLTVQHHDGSFTVPLVVRVFDFALTDVSHTRTAYGLMPLEDWHGLQWATPEQVRQVWDLYLRNMARHRASPYYPQLYSAVQYTYQPGTDSFTHNFGPFSAAMDEYLEEYHFNSFRDLSFYSGFPQIPGVPTFTPDGLTIHPEYWRLYPKLMQPVFQHFRERGWMGTAFAQWIDEPAAAQMPLVRLGMELIQNTAPDHDTLLATFFGPVAELFDLVTLWVPHWDFDMYFEHVAPRRAAGDEVWYYVCTIPKDPWPNSFIDQAGVAPRLRQWYAELWQLDGEDYWGANHYIGITNPWVQTMSRFGNATNGYYNLGHGDGYVLYPPVREKPTNTVIVAGPVNSVRFETVRDGYEDREYFWLLQRALVAREPVLGTNHPAVVEARAAYAEAMGLLPWPPILPHEPHRLAASRLRVAEAIEALDDGAPFIAKDPLNKVCRPGENQTLRVEAVGWPLPSLQWQRNGTNLPGATERRLVLTSLTAAHTGDYRVIASNAHGSVTSAVGRLTVLLTNDLPLFVAQPKSLHRGYGTRAVFGGGVSSLTPLTYQWLKNGALLSGETNTTLVLTNLNDTHAGTYALIASNANGSLTSAPAILTVAAPPGSVPPQVIAPPVSQTVNAGSNVTFTVSASGTTPLNYQWRFHGTNLPGATATNLSFTNVQPFRAGPYDVVIGNVAGWATSAVATLTVQTFAPYLTLSPSNLTLAQNQNAQFTAAAGGSPPLAFQWFFNGTNALPGATAPSLLLTNVQPAQTGNYALRVTNLYGAITSTPALLQLSGMPGYTTEPPGITALRQGGFQLGLLPDNRARTVLVSTNLQDWTWFTNVPPSAAQENLPVPLTNAPRRFFRVFVTP